MRQAFYSVFNALSQTKPRYGIGDFNLYRPVAVAAIRSMQEYDLFLKGLVAWIGFNPVFVQHDVRVQPGRNTRWSLKQIGEAHGGRPNVVHGLAPTRLVASWAALAMISFFYLAATLVQTDRLEDP